MFEKRFCKIEEYYKTLEMEDVTAKEHCWQDLTNLICLNFDSAISFMKSCTEYQAELISAVMDDVTFRMKSRRFIAALRELDKKYPDLKMKALIDADEKVVADILVD